MVRSWFQWFLFLIVGTILTNVWPEYKNETISYDLIVMSHKERVDFQLNLVYFIAWLWSCLRIDEHLDEVKTLN